MRKALLFLVLFGLGLTLLLLLQDRPLGRRGAGPGPSEQPVEAPEEAPGPDAPGVTPPGVAPAGGQDEVPGGVSGTLTFRAYDEQTNRQVYLFQADMQNLGGGSYLGRDVSVHVLDPADGTLTETIEAERGRLRIELVDGNPRIGDDERLDLEVVVVTRLGPGPFAPLVLRSPSLDVSGLGGERRTMRSGEGDLVVIEGKGLRGQGQGFVVREGEGEGVLALEQGGELTIDLGERGRLRLSTPEGGPILVRTAETDTEPGAGQELRASQGARLDFWPVEADAEQESESTLDADELVLRGGEGPDGVFVLRSVRAAGDVRLARGADRYLGQQGRLEFSADGRAEQAVLEGSPSGRVELRARDGSTYTVVSSGEAPLVVELGALSVFGQDGPARLEVPELGIELNARDRLSGSVDENSEYATFQAQGAVRIDQGRRVLTTDSIDGEIQSAGGGRLRALCSGRTHLVGEDRTGAPADVLSNGRSEFEVGADTWQVRYAESVRFSSERDPAYQAQADVLRDLDPAARTFTAEGNVALENVFGRAEATRVLALGREHLELFGLPSRPARFVVSQPGSEFESAGFEAQQIDIFADRVVASTAVVGRVRDALREHVVHCESAVLAVEPRDEELGTRPFTLECRGVSESRVSMEGSVLRCSTAHLLATGRLREPKQGEQDDGPGSRKIETGRVIATGRVEIQHEGEFSISGSGEVFRLEPDGTSILESPSGRRVSAWGAFGAAGVPYRLTADRLTVDGQSLQALAPRVTIDATLLPVVPRGDAVRGFTEASGELLSVDAGEIFLRGRAHLEGLDRSGEPLVVDAETIRLSGAVREARFGQGAGWIRGLQATGGFQATYGVSAEASGESFAFDQTRALFLGSPASVTIRGLRLVSTRIDLDLQSYLIETDAGWVENVVPDGGWRMDFATMEPIRRDDETLFVVRQPRSVQGEYVMRAGWALAWIDAAAWRQRGDEALWGAPPSAAPVELPRPYIPEVDLVENPFRRIVDEQAALFVEKLYLEGDVEMLESGSRVVRTDALLLDLRENTGYMQNADLRTRIEMRGKLQEMRTRTGTLRMRANGSLAAKQATLTSCDFAQPHYVVQTGDLELVPRRDGGWRVSIRKNLLRFGGGFQLPLPPIGGLVLDEEGDIKGFETSTGEVVGVETVGVGDSARFGTSVNTGFQTEAGKVGLGVGKIAGFKGKTVRGRWKYDGSYLGSRGVLLGIGLELRERDPNKDKEQQAWLNIYTSGLEDSGEDRGYVRVDEEDRASYRAWYRARGRYPLSHEEWIDVAFSHQTDPGVQAEFFERLYTRFEQRDNELHYRRADGADYWNVAAKVRVDQYRTQIEKLPALGFYHGSTPIASLGRLKLEYTGAIDVGYLRRKQGTFGEPEDATVIEGFTEYFEEVFADGRGNQEVVRADSAHALELPTNLGLLGLRARPYARARLTGWDRGLDEEQEIGRAGAFAGLELASTIWRRNRRSITDITPSILFEEELGVVHSGDPPLRFDGIDDPIDGDRLELGLRTRWRRVGVPRRLDFEVRNVRNWDRDPAHPSGTHRDDILLLADMSTELFGLPFAILHDLRWDRRSDEVDYWRGALGLSPVEDVNLEFAYTRAAIVTDPLLADALEQELFEPRFEAISGKARWRMTDKWEVEVGQTISLIDDGRLDNELILRRYGHDFLVEIELNNRTGEGAGFGLSFTPLLTYRPRRLGLLE